MQKLIPENPDLSDIFRAYPHGALPLMQFHDIYLRQESPLSVAERELIAAFVSGLNACKFCYGAHTVIAEAFGVSTKLIEDLVEDIETAEIEERFRPLFRFVKVLTETPSRVSEELRQAVLDAGFCERSLHDTVVICALFNFMNRLIEGQGVVTNDVTLAAQRERHKQDPVQEVDENTYVNYGRRIGVIE